MKSFVISFWKSFWEFLGPKEFYAWQTPLWLSILAWGLSQLTTNPADTTVPVTAHAILTSFSWAFLVIATGWFTTVNPVRLLGQNLGPWITGALLCLFLFGRGDAPMARTALLTWPLISAAIAAFPDFFRVESGFQVPKRLQTRQDLIVLALVNLLLTSWILFGLNIQDWMAEYPGVRGEQFEQSLFVQPSPSRTEDFSRGTSIVEAMRGELVKESVGLTKPQMERWLFDNQRNPQIFSDAVMGLLAQANNGRRLDQKFWRLETIVGEPEYRVTLRAIWRGPRPKTDIDGHVVQSTCQITFGTTNLSQIDCDEEAQVFPAG